MSQVEAAEYKKEKEKGKRKRKKRKRKKKEKEKGKKEKREKNKKEKKEKGYQISIVHFDIKYKYLNRPWILGTIRNEHCVIWGCLFC